MKKRNLPKSVQSEIAFRKSMAEIAAVAAEGRGSTARHARRFIRECEQRIKILQSS